MKSDRVAVAIIGGGFSGTILAAQLARRGIASILIDGSGRMGRGVAYSTSEPAHLLRMELDDRAKPDFGAEVTIKANRAGTVHALAG